MSYRYCTICIVLNAKDLSKGEQYMDFRLKAVIGYSNNYLILLWFTILKTLTYKNNRQTKGNNFLHIFSTRF